MITYCLVIALVKIYTFYLPLKVDESDYIDLELKWLVLYCQNFLQGYYSWQLLCVHGVGTSKWLDYVVLFQDNARRVYDRGCGANTKFGKLSKLGLAPLLWCIIIGMLITYIHSVISGKSTTIFLFFRFHSLDVL